MSIKDWDPEFVIAERLSWLNVEGVPLHAWNDDNFKKIGSCVGRVILIDNNTSQRKVLDGGRLLVSTELSNICKTISLKVSSKDYVVSIREMFEGRWSILPISQFNSDIPRKSVSEIGNKVVRIEIDEGCNNQVPIVDSNQDVRCSEQCEAQVFLGDGKVCSH